MTKQIFTAAVAGLFMFTACNQTETTSAVAPQSNNNTETSATGVALAYVNMDTLQVKYLHYKKIADQLKSEIEAADQEMRKKQNALQENYAQFQKMAPEMTQEELQYYGQDLQQSEQKIMAQQQALENDLMQKQQIIMDNLKVELDSVLTTIRTNNNLDFIFTYPIGSGLLSVNQNFDITLEVTDALNAFHVEEEESENE